MKKVASATDPLHASLLIGVLEDHGIEAIVQGEALWGARGELPLTPESAPSIWVVRDEDAQPALEALAKHEVDKNVAVCRACGCDLRGRTDAQCPECGTSLPESDNWNCADCGERSAAQFTHCWSCGLPRDPDQTVIPRLSKPAELEKAASSEPQRSDCSRCHGTGVRRQLLVPGICAFLAMLLVARATDRIGSLASSSMIADRLIDFTFLMIVAAGFVYLAVKSSKCNCACIDED